MSEYPATRKEAKRLGYTRYFTGKPCKHGHLSLRMTRNKDCIDCRRNWRREHGRKRYRNDPEFRERCRKYAREYVRNRRQTDPEFRERYLRLHRERGKERYHNDIEFRARCNAVTSSRRKRCRCQTPPWADLKEIEAVYAEAQRLTEETGVPYEVDHVYPINGDTVSGLHVAENLRPVPMSMNRAKSNANPDLVSPPAVLYGLAVRSRPVYEPTL